jgi:hypothetical protein
MQAAEKGAGPFADAPTISSALFLRAFLAHNAAQTNGVRA